LNAAKAGITSLNLPGVSARYLAIEILSNQGDTAVGGRVGFYEIAITAAPPDSDNDGLPDGLSDFVENGSGVWGGISNPGTSPIKADTDSDGLKDSVETNTGTYLSTTNTGTNPLNPNSDGDSAGDWYEVAIIDKDPALGSPPNSPNNSALKPNIPYPLPDPNPLDTGVTNKPVKVYIMD